MITAIFDIGKTNKKFFLLDENLNEIYKEYIQFEEVTDDDGFPCENLQEVVQWIENTFNRYTRDPTLKITHVNFSTYGASLVHLDENYNVVTPFYNYLKPLPEEFHEHFLSRYGNRESFALSTSSPYLGMLNAGLQLYYLKYFKPALFSKIRYAVHFPQYLSSLFTQRLYSDYTSIGCHTGLWDFSNYRYAPWVKEEGLDQLLCPVTSSTQSVINHKIRFGVGIHDSSSALIPYTFTSEEPFTLISTGTWSICLNPFNASPLTKRELELDCLNFMDARGNSVKASRLFLGEHFSNTLNRLAHYFQVEKKNYQLLIWNNLYTDKRENKKALLFNHQLIQPERFGFENGADENFSLFCTYDEAVYQLFDEITDIQIASLQLAIGETKVRNIYIDGGFSNSEVFTHFLADKLPEFTIYAASSPIGSTLGAALVVNPSNVPDFHYTRLNVKH
mgnify:CR=1 FL=1